MKFKKGDQVLIISGDDKGKKGKIEKIFINDRKIIVSGINIHKKSIKPSKKNPSGGKVDIQLPISISNAVIICPSCNQPTKINYSLKNKDKKRICRKCKGLIDVQS